MKYREETPDDQQFSGTFRKWIAGAALPALLLLYGIWVILPPHFSGHHFHSGGAGLVWTFIALAWGVMAISVALMCFCFYFFGGMTSWAWVEVVFVVSSITLAASGFGLLILLCAAAVFGNLHRYR